MLKYTIILLSFLFVINLSAQQIDNQPIQSANTNQPSGVLADYYASCVGAEIFSIVLPV